MVSGVSTGVFWDMLVQPSCTIFRDSPVYSRQGAVNARLCLQWRHHSGGAGQERAGHAARSKSTSSGFLVIGT